MGMEEDSGYFLPIELEKSSLLTRLINIFRVVMYFSVAYVQFIYLECLQPGSTVPCDSMLVYVPIFLGCLDSVMILWSTQMTKHFWQVAFLLSVLAIAVSINSLIPIYQSNPPYSFLDTAMIVFAGLVLLVSIIELLYYRESFAKKQYSIEAFQQTGEMRTY